MFDGVTLESMELIDAGDDEVVAVIRVTGRAKVSRVDTALTYAVVDTVSAGRISRVREYWTKDEALQALSTPDVSGFCPRPTHRHENPTEAAQFLR